MYEYLLIAIRSLSINKLRSGMTLLGMVIGVWAITSMQGVVSGFDRSMAAELSVLGAETFVIQKFPPIVLGHNWRKYARRKDFTYHDALYLQDVLTNIRAATVVVERYANTVKYQDKKTSPSVKVVGTMEDYLSTQSIDLADGRFIVEDDVTHSRNIAIIGRDVAAELFPYEDPLDRRIVIGNQAYLVVGVLDQSASTFEESADNVVIMPVTTYEKVFTSGGMGMGGTGLVVRAWDSEAVGAVLDETIAVLRVRRNVPIGEENDFEVVTAESVMNTMVNFTSYIRVAAIGVAAVSLLVAGIGIMNIMLVSVMERTKEIGTRKAVGGRRRDILMQFLFEAVLLSEVGALIGILLGIATSRLLSPILNMEASVPAWAMISAFGYCSVIGIFFGLYPANKAAKLDPIEALRYE